MCQFFFILVVSRGEPGVPPVRVFELIAWTPVVSLGEPGVPEGLLDVPQAYNVTAAAKTAGSSRGVSFWMFITIF
jgi:hypothetical protein